jgi:hypothetical protein
MCAPHWGFPFLWGGKFGEGRAGPLNAVLPRFHPLFLAKDSQEGSGDSYAGGPA